MGEALSLPVDDEVNRALRKNTTSFERCRPTQRKPSPSISAVNSPATASPAANSKKLSLLSRQQAPTATAAGRRAAPATGGATRRELLANCAQRTHAVNRDHPAVEAPRNWSLKISSESGPR